MGGFHITPKTNSRVGLSFGSEQKKDTPLSKDEQFKQAIAKKASPLEEPDALALLSGAEQSEQTTYLERLNPRETQHSVGTSALKVELGYQTEGPQILTRSTDPTLIEQVKSLNGTPSETNFFKDKTFKTGTEIQPAEGVALHVGVAAAMIEKHSEPTLGSEAPTVSNRTSAGVYAGVKVDQGPVSSQVSVDTALGKPRVGAGMAFNIADTATIGMTYLRRSINGDEIDKNTVRLGTEIKASADLVIGINVTQPINTSHTDSTSVGVYLNSKFD